MLALIRVRSLLRSFGGDNVPFHDFTTFVTRHLAPTSLARTGGGRGGTEGRMRAFAGSILRASSVVRVPRPCRVPLRRVRPFLHASLRVTRSSKVHWVRLKFALMASW